MSLIRAFATFLESAGFGTFETDLFIGGAPSSNVAPSTLWWLKSYGGTPAIRLRTGEMVKTYQVQVFYRDYDPKNVEDKLFALEERLNDRNTPQLVGFNTVETEAFTFPYDNDLDDEERKIGLLQANITIYKE
jgi:hypothetical protein